MILLLIILAISTSIYLYFILQSMCEILKKPFEEAAKQNKTGLSIIIPYRNEGDNISKLQAQLNTALKSFSQYEVIWMNDHSDDGSEPKNTDYHHTINLISDQKGKKTAIRKGIENAQYNDIICLDCDIDINPLFFDKLLENWTRDVHICPVIIRPSGFWSSIWSLESYALCGLTVGMAKNQNPIMNNGAAWAFHKSDWEKLTIRHLNHPSGDDIFTLEAFKQNQATFSSGCTKHEVVMVQCPSNFRSFLDQRTRWAGKSARIKDTAMRLFGMSTLIMYLTIISGLIFSLIYSFSAGFILILSIKYIIDFSLLFLVSIKAGLPRLLWAYPILSIVYPLYAVFIAFASLTYRAKWKGR